MSALRSVLICGVLVAALAGCGNEECSLPRHGDEENCDSYDGGQLSFVVGDPLPDLSAYCASQCVDVFATVAIAGYDDLRKVPLLSKVRSVDGLRINLDALRDLRGLERVDVVRNLTLFGQNGDTSRRTLEGLADQEMWSLSVEQATGLANFDGASLKQVDSMVVSRSSVQTLDLSATQVTHLSVLSNNNLRSLAIPSGAMNQVWITVNPLLSELSWSPGLTVENLRVESNSSLSNCLVQQFVEQTDAGAPRSEVLIRNNGPCP